MFFLVEYTQQGSAELRDQHRGTHIAYRKSLGSDLVLAGPLLDDDGNPNGSVVIIAAASRNAAETVAGRDPYLAAGVFALKSVRPLRIAAIAPPQP
ncbi:MAG: YciI family protein [Steroidobacteraceae bacterium]